MKVNFTDDMDWVKKSEMEELLLIPMSQPGGRDQGSPRSSTLYDSLITDPNKDVAEVHDRMPVIIVEAKDLELREHRDSKDAGARGLLQKWPASTRMNLFA
jgi:putative SOS response-associated peptidase YedK